MIALYYIKDTHLNGHVYDKIHTSFRDKYQLGPVHEARYNLHFLKHEKQQQICLLQ